MERHAPPAEEIPHISTPAYDTAHFVCACGESLFDTHENLETEEWKSGHKFECDHCGRKYELLLETVRGPTNTYPNCPQCGAVVHENRGPKDADESFYACYACSYSVPVTDDESVFRRRLLAHKVQQRVLNALVDGDEDYRYSGDTHVSERVDLTDEFREALDYDAVDSLPPSDEWLDAQVDRLLDAGILTTTA